MFVYFRLSALMSVLSRQGRASKYPCNVDNNFTEQSTIRKQEAYLCSITPESSRELTVWSQVLFRKGNQELKNGIGPISGLGLGSQETPGNCTSRNGVEPLSKTHSSGHFAHSEPRAPKHLAFKLGNGLRKMSN